jgi:hypothetical protein
MVKENAANTDVFGDLQSLNRPRDAAWGNWAKFEKEGDFVQGFIRDVFYRQEERDESGQGFSDQRGITLEQKDGTLINLGIKTFPWILALTDNLRIGDPMRATWEKTMPPKSKMYKGAKVFKYEGKNLPENANNKTVRELYEADKLAGGTVSPGPSPEVAAQDAQADADLEAF